MSRRRTQGYRMEVEFILANRSNYPVVRDDIRRLLKSWEASGQLQIDFISIECIEGTSVDSRTPKT